MSSRKSNSRRNRAQPYDASRHITPRVSEDSSSSNDSHIDENSLFMLAESGPPIRSSRRTREQAQDVSRTAPQIDENLLFSLPENRRTTPQFDENSRFRLADGSRNSPLLDSRKAKSSMRSTNRQRPYDARKRHAKRDDDSEDESVLCCVSDTQRYLALKRALKKGSKNGKKKRVTFSLPHEDESTQTENLPNSLLKRPTDSFKNVQKKRVTFSLPHEDESTQTENLPKSLLKKPTDSFKKVQKKRVSFDRRADDLEEEATCCLLTDVPSCSYSSPSTQTDCPLKSAIKKRVRCMLPPHDKSTQTENLPKSALKRKRDDDDRTPSKKRVNFGLRPDDLEEEATRYLLTDVPSCSSEATQTEAPLKSALKKRVRFVSDTQTAEPSVSNATPGVTQNPRHGRKKRDSKSKSDRSKKP